MNDDLDIWPIAHIEDLWIFDKLILSKKLGYVCGPKGIQVPKPDNYIVRPITNLLGMGRGSKFEFIKDSTDHIPEGYFWCEVFKGRHLSVDYFKGEQKLCVEGFRPKLNNTQRWNKWEKVNDKIEYPKILKELKGQYDWVNVELIDNRIIEIHLRKSTDFDGHNSNYAIPVYKNSTIKPNSDQKFIKDEVDDRLGFIIQK